jgi:hypothetical protein
LDEGKKDTFSVRKRREFLSGFNDSNSIKRLCILLLFFVSGKLYPASFTIVTNTVELGNAINQKAGEISLDADIFILNNDIKINYDCIILPLRNVVIDCNYWTFDLSDANIVIDGNYINSITFIDGSDNVLVSSENNDTSVELNYCRFINSWYGNGLTLKAKKKLNVTCNRCEANLNYSDGFNVHNLSPGADKTMLFLNDCNAVGNDRLGIGGACGDGVTAHDANHSVYINGGIYRDNGKTGISLLNQAKCYVKGASFSNNGTIVALGGIYGDVWAYFEIRNCVFTKEKTAINLQEGWGPITNCSFYDNDIHIKLNQYITVKNCIFEKAKSIAVSPGYDSRSGYNCFWNNVSNFDSGGFSTGDIVAEPMFTDSERGDFHLRSQHGRWDPQTNEWLYDVSTSNCIDSGDPNIEWTKELWPNGGRVDIGAYGDTAEASMSSSSIGYTGDLNYDYNVDFADFAIFANRWEDEKVLLAEDLNRDGFVGIEDLYLICEDWIRP